MVNMCVCREVYFAVSWNKTSPPRLCRGRKLHLQNKTKQHKAVDRFTDQQNAFSKLYNYFFKLISRLHGLCTKVERRVPQVYVKGDRRFSAT